MGLKKARLPEGTAYEAFDQIDGSHSYRAAVPNGHIDYRVRFRPGGTVYFFNFELAKQMGLIDRDHPDTLTSALRTKILDTFSLQIINEYDLQKNVAIPECDIRPHPYMATRYLQLQHPDKKGTTSGDGRGIWNGEIRHRGRTWDIISSGTGATRLSPAYAMTKKFIKTGDQRVGYGNGYNYLQDGLSAALMSESFHLQGIETERTLALISFEGGSSINVRAGPNLLRPAHLFHFLKQGRLQDLRQAVDYFIARQAENGDLPDMKGLPARKRYERFAEYEALTFSAIAAKFEAEYVFCWLDWDGDNILANGGIIDYGSVRQFGLFHREYRYDDVDRMSTNIPEQRIKARYTVQNFAQIRDFLLSGKKRPIEAFRKDPLLKLFDRNFRRCLQQNLLRKLGYSREQTAFLLEKHPGQVGKLKRLHATLERVQSVQGTYRTPDGITGDAVFCMASLNRELPKRLCENARPLPEPDLVNLIRSSYARPRDLKSRPARSKTIRALQERYLAVARLVSERFHQGNLNKTLLQLTMRSSVENPELRLTGDGILHFTTSLIRNRKRLSAEETFRVIRRVIGIGEPRSRSRKIEEIVNRNLKALRGMNEGI